MPFRTGIWEIRRQSYQDAMEGIDITRTHAHTHTVVFTYNVSSLGSASLPLMMSRGNSMEKIQPLKQTKFNGDLTNYS